MYLIELDNETIDKCLEQNEYVLISVYENSNIVTEMMEGVLAHVKRNINDKIMIALIRRDYLNQYTNEYNNILPQLILFKNKKIIDRMSGLKRVSQIIDFVNQYAC